MRRVLDWVITLAVAVGFVLVFEAEVAKPFRIPSGSMEPTLHCAKPGPDCEARFNDRVIANRLVYRFEDPKRGQIVVFHAPAHACGIGGVFVKLIGHPSVMKLCTHHGLPHPMLMRFVLKLLANLTDQRGGDAMDRIINALARLAPAV